MRGLALAMILGVCVLVVAPPAASQAPACVSTTFNDYDCSVAVGDKCIVHVGNHYAPGGHDYGGPDVDDECR